MTDAFSEQDEEIKGFELQKKHWLALVVVFAVIELAVLVALIS
jgi:hypothetical protein